MISIVLPTYNRAVYLREAIGSVLAQSYPHFELIVVDDGSTDATPQVVAEMNDPRVQYIRLPGNSGVSVARNVGICYAAGELVAFLDDDDAYYPEFLSHVAGMMAEAGPEVGFCWCGIRIFRGKLDDAWVVRERLVLIPSFPDRAQAFRNAWGKYLPATSHGLCIRKACFATIGLFIRR